MSYGNMPPPPPNYGDAPPPGYGYGGVPAPSYANWGQRVGAYLIDYSHPSSFWKSSSSRWAMPRCRS